MATAIGMVAGICVITSMVLRSQRWIKALLLLGAVLFLAYGIMLRLAPIIMLNSVGTLVGIAEVVRRFDVVAIQEVKTDTAAIRMLVEDFLGPDWGLIVSDVSAGEKGNA